MIKTVSGRTKATGSNAELLTDFMGTAEAILRKTKITVEQLHQAIKLAETVYSDVSSICRWEHGENITWRKFLEIAGVLGYTVDVEVSRGTEL